MTQIENKEAGDSVRAKINDALGVTDLVKVYETRQDFVDAVGDGLTVGNGGAVLAAGLGYLADDTSVDISDLPGFVPLGDVFPDHFGYNEFPAATDMLAAINSAISYVSAQGGGVVNFDGDYGVSGTVSVTSNSIHLIGSGKHATKVQFNAAISNIPVIKIGQSGQDTIRGSIRDMSLFSNQPDQTSSAALSLFRCGEYYVDNVHVRGGYGQILIEGAGELLNISNTDCRFAAITTPQADSFSIKIATGDGKLSFLPAISNVNINGEDVSGAAADHGILVTGCDGLLISDSHVAKSRIGMITFAPESPSTLIQNVNISNIQLDGAVGGTTNTQYGVYYEADGFGSRIVQRHSFSNVSILRTAKHGLFIEEDVDDINWVGGTIHNVSEDSIRIETGTNIRISDVNSIGPSFFTSASSFGHVQVTGGQDILISGVQGRGRNQASSLVGRGVYVSGGDNVAVNGCTMYDTIEPFYVDYTTGIRQLHGCTSDRSIGVASGSSITLPAELGVVNITGTTQIDDISLNNWHRDRQVTLIFSSAVTLKDLNNIQLRGDFAASSTSSITLRAFSGKWWEMCRTT